MADEKHTLKESTIKRMLEMAGLSSYQDEVLAEGKKHFKYDTVIKEEKSGKKDTTGSVNYSEKTGKLPNVTKGTANGAASKKGDKKVLSDDECMSEGEDPTADADKEVETVEEGFEPEGSGGDEFGGEEPGADPTGLDSDTSANDSVVDVDLMGLAAGIADLFAKQFPSKSFKMSVDGVEVGGQPEGGEGFGGESEFGSEPAGGDEFGGGEPASEPEPSFGSEESAPEPERDRMPESTQQKVVNMVYEAIMKKLEKDVGAKQKETKKIQTPAAKQGAANKNAPAAVKKTSDKAKTAQAPAATKKK